MGLVKNIRKELEPDRDEYSDDEDTCVLDLDSLVLNFRSTIYKQCDLQHIP